MEKVDLIRERMDVSYREAKDALDRAGGDLVAALIVLEEEREGEGFCGKWKAILEKGAATKVRLKKGEASKEKSENRKIFWEETLHQAELFLERSLSLAQEDGFAIKDFVEGDPLGPGKATEIPLEIARCTGEIIALITDALPKSYAPIRADAECARCLAEGSRKAALTVAQHNIPLLSAEERQNYVDQIVELAFPG